MNARKFLNIALSLLVLVSLVLTSSASVSAQGDAAPKAGVQNQKDKKDKKIKEKDRKEAAARSFQEGALNPLMLVEPMAMMPGEAPHYFSHPNYANSPLPTMTTTPGGQTTVGHAMQDRQFATDNATNVFVVLPDALTDGFPRQELYGLGQQMRRAAVSIPSNIAEGYGRKTHKQRFSFLENALGSVFELETQMELASRLGYPATENGSLANEIRKLGQGIAALMRFVERDSRNFVHLRPS